MSQVLWHQGSCREEQISQDGMVRCSHPTASNLAPHFVNNDHATAEITYSAALHIPGYSLGHRLVSPAWASPGKPWLLLHRGHIGAASWLCYGSVTVVLWVLLWQLHQPGENKHVCIPTAPPVFFQPLIWSINCLGFSEPCQQCEQ